MRRAALLLCVIVIVLAACEQEGGPSAPAARPAPAAPSGLIAEIVVPRPGPLLAEARQASGGSALFVPRTLGGLVVNLLGFSLRMAEQVDEELPLAGAIARREAAIDAAFAVHVKDGGRFVAQASTGEDGSFGAARDGELTWLEPGERARPARLGLSVAVIDNYLVAGSGREAVARLAPYLARAVGRRELQLPPQSLAVDLKPGALEALVGSLRVPAVPSSWGALVDRDELFGTVRAVGADLGGGRLLVTLGEKELVAEVTFEARDEKAAERIAALPTVASSELLHGPGDSVAIAAWAESRESRLSQAKARAGAFAALLGDELDKTTREHIAHAFEALAQGRGDHTSLGLRCSGAGLTGFARGPAAEPAELRKGIEAILALENDATVQKRLRELDLELAAKKTRIERVPFDVWRLRLSAPEKKEGEAPPPIDLLGGVSDSMYFAAGGMETVETVQRLHGAEADQTLASHAIMKNAAGALVPRTWLAALADPQGLHACLQGKPGGSFATPIALGIGPRDRKVQARVAIARPLLRLAAALLE